VRDSKQLAPSQREKIAPRIWEHAQAASVAFVSVEAIDRIGIAEASRQAMLAAIGGLSVRPQHLLIDAFRLSACSINQTALIRGDVTSLSIACASIIAKVARDRAMDQYHEVFPKFGFDHNKGYGTTEHIEAIQLHGPCDLHRRTFAPVREMLISNGSELRSSVPI
jgi:ribonuclease HII